MSDISGGVFFSQEDFREEGNKGETERDGLITNLPIVFVHLSNSDYLKYSLAQAKATNPGSAIHLIGDSSNDCYSFVDHHQFSDHSQGANAFSKIYRHYSTLGVRFELFCFQRWLVLRDFLVARDIPECLYLDSDVMLYADVTTERTKFEQFDFTLSNKICGSTFFLNRIEALNKFCNFLFAVYSKKDRYNYDRIVAHFAVRRKNHLPGGACDMTAFDLYHGEHAGEIGETAQIIDGSLYDPGINDPNPGFEMSEGIKKLIWKDGLPYGRHIKTGKEIRFNSLHCQGRAKDLMGKFYTGK